jgi:hypothetical protein
VVVAAPPVQPIYHACNRPVYFGKSAEYEPGYRPDHHDHERRDDDHDHGHHDD